jgi:hypothetical protein
MLVSPKRLIKASEITEEDKLALADLVKEYAKGSYAIHETVKVTKKEDEYIIEDGLTYAKAAYLAEVPYVPIENQK